MTQYRSFHGLVSVGGMLYAMGGKTGRCPTYICCLGIIMLSVLFSCYW